VPPAVAQDVGDGASGPPGVVEHLVVIALGPDAAFVAGQGVELAAQGGLEALHRARDGRPAAWGLDDEVDVIALNREVDDAKASALRPEGERVLDERTTDGAAQVGDALDDAEGDVQRTVT